MSGYAEVATLLERLREATTREAAALTRVAELEAFHLESERQLRKAQDARVVAEDARDAALRDLAALRERLREAETTVIVLLHAYETDNRPPDAFVSKAMRIRSRLDASPQAAPPGSRWHLVGCPKGMAAFNDQPCGCPGGNGVAATPVQGAPLACTCAPYPGRDVHDGGCPELLDSLKRSPPSVQAAPADGPTPPALCDMTHVDGPCWKCGESPVTTRHFDPDKKPRAPGCRCHQEEGDSECPVHDAQTAPSR